MSSETLIYCRLKPSFQTTSTPAISRPSEASSLSEQSPEGHAEQYQYAEHHSGGVGVDKAGL
ncbi:hypothetical protein, partial [Neisseria gonorrhoeae]